MEATRYLETLVTVWQTKRRLIPEHSNLQTATSIVFCSEDGVSSFLRNVGNHLLHYTASYQRREIVKTNRQQMAGNTLLDT
jgi:hypothetical protein